MLYSTWQKCYKTFIMRMHLMPVKHGQYSLIIKGLKPSIKGDVYTDIKNKLDGQSHIQYIERVE